MSGYHVSKQFIWPANVDPCPWQIRQIEEMKYEPSSPHRSHVLEHADDDWYLAFAG
jgi:hypothetical protein